MSGIVTILIIGAIGSICIGVVASMASALSLRKKVDKLILIDEPVYWSFGIWTMILGIFLMLAPADWYGPSWSYFPELPHNGFGMGLCLTCLSFLQLLALWRESHWRSFMLFLIGFVYWVTGIILGAEGLLGHQGLMESPFILFVGALAITLSNTMRTRRGPP